MRIGLIGLDSSHTEDFLRHFNAERRYAGMAITAIIGGSPERIRELTAGLPDVAVAESADALVREVDAVIVGSRDGGLHREQALVAIAARRPVFVDKPLANSVADAETIINAAAASGTPLFSGSALRWQGETARLKARLSGLDGPLDLRAWGTWYPDSPYGGPVFYAIHTIELVLELVGPEWRDLTQKGHAAVRYKSGPHRVTLEFRPLGSSGTSEFGVAVKAGRTAFEQSILLGDDYMAPVAAKIAAMLQYGNAPMDREALLAPVRMMAEIEAALG